MPCAFLDQVVLVTGAATGIGQATALRFAADGATVVIADRDASGAQETVRRATDAGGRAAYHAVDLAHRAERDTLVPAVLEAHHRLDVLVNNAATTGERVTLAKLDYPEWDAVLETNLAATVFLARDAGAHMAARGHGCIINLTSIQQRMPVPTHLAYAASKGAITAVTRAMAVELSPAGVRVNAVEPGAIATDAFQNTLAAQAPGQALPAVPTLLGHAGRAEDVAEVIAFLASDRARFLTGTVLTVDGGRALSRRPDPFQVAFDDAHEEAR